MSKKLAIGITGSFCNHSNVLQEFDKINNEEYEIVFFVTPNVFNTDTRFGMASELIQKLESISRRGVVSSIAESELLVNQGVIDQMIIMPCTATTCSKLVHGIYDNAVLMCAKSLLRNGHSVSLAIATNDGLGISGGNIMKLMNIKNIFLVPFGQDDYLRKPNSLVCDFTKCFETVDLAYQKKQIQPVLLGAKGVHYE